MAFVNLPPNLQDMFYGITDRIAKLETGPNEAMYTAEYAQTIAYSAEDLALYSQSVATQAQIQAINAGIAANQAASQATIAQSQATIASTQATAAQTSANGKNKNTYSTGAPGTTANIAGDLWFQYGTSAPYTNKVIAQFIGNGGNSWSPMPITGLVVTNIDAGSITTGTLDAISITAGSGSQKFTVSSTGYMAAQGVYIKGNITADSGTFNGTINAQTGYFGGTTNYWSIGSNGITGVGTAEITGGKINGSSIVIGSNFSVSTAGIMSCSGAIVTGQINATSGYIGSEVNGWNFTSTGFLKSYDGSTIFYPTSASNSYFVISTRGMGVGGVQSSGDIFTTGSARVTGQGTTSNRCEFNYYNTIQLHSISSGYGVDSAWSPNSDNTYDLGLATSNGASQNRRWRRLYSNNTTISTSDARLKTDIADSPLGLDFIEALRPVSYRWIVGTRTVVKDADGNGIVIGESPEGKPIFQMDETPGVRLHYGFIAQEVKQVLDQSGVEDFAGYVHDDLSDPDSTLSLSYEQFIAPLVKAVQELSNRVKQLEG